MTRIPHLLTLLFACIAGAQSVQAEQCRFSHEFASSADLDAITTSLATADLGSGPRLLVGGNFQRAGGQYNARIAQWNGHIWNRVGDGLPEEVTDLVLFDDGSGAQLYASTARVGASGAEGDVYRLEGGTWTAIGESMDLGVLALAVFNDGDGPALYAGGRFVTADGAPGDYLARYRNGTWSAVPGGALDQSVEALLVHDDGAGSALYAGGRFRNIGGSAVNHVARFRGGAWQPLGDGTNLPVSALASHDDGGGTALYVGGQFTAPAVRIPRWQGGQWSALGGGANGFVRALASWQVDGQPLLLVGGGFSEIDGVARPAVAAWTGSAWASMGEGFGSSTQSGNVLAFEVADLGSGPTLYAAGRLDRSGSTTLGNIARWDGSAWRAVQATAASGGAGSAQQIRAMVEFDHGAGPALYAGGQFPDIDGNPVRGVARWTGAAWQPIPGGPDGSVLALAAHDDGSGPALYAGGNFLTTGGQPIPFLARWDGDQWSKVDASPNGAIIALASGNIGGVPLLFAGGNYSKIGDDDRLFVAAWNGESWSALGSGLDQTVRSLTVYDLGNGPRLFAAGSFTFSGSTALARVAQWDGSAWSALGNGVASQANVVRGFDDGSGPRLYVGGEFDQAGGQTALGVASWTGSAWQPLPEQPGSLAGTTSLLAVESASESALYIGGTFSEPGSPPRRGLMRFDGANWSAPGGGITPDLQQNANDPQFPLTSVFAMSPFSHGGLDELFFGGQFDRVGTTPSHNIGSLRCTRDIEPYHSGLWFDPARDGEGFVLEKLQDGRFFGTWYTYDLDGTQMWLAGIGVLVGDTIDMQMIRTSGGIFGPAFDPALVVREPWGKLRFRFSSCDIAHVDYVGPAEYGHGSYRLVHLARLAGHACGSDSVSAPLSGFSAHYFDPAQDGQGYTVYLVNNDQDPRAIVVWFAYDEAGNQAWMIGEGEFDGERLVVDRLVQPVGARWGREFDPADVDRVDWGSMEFAFGSCAQGTVSYDSVFPNFGAGSQPFVRLTNPAGLTCSP
jgi:hypothetical protein